MSAAPMDCVLYDAHFNNWNALHHTACDTITRSWSLIWGWIKDSNGKQQFNAAKKYYFVILQDKTKGVCDVTFHL